MKKVIRICIRLLESVTKLLEFISEKVIMKKLKKIFCIIQTGPSEQLPNNIDGGCEWELLPRAPSRGFSKASQLDRIQVRIILVPESFGPGQNPSLWLTIPVSTTRLISIV